VQPARATSAPTQNSLAVLYFDNLSPDTADAYLADGLTEEITDRLGEIERLEVKSRTSVRRLQNSVGGDLAALSRALRVRYVVEGSVRRAGPRVRVSVRLVRAEDGSRVWGGRYERAAADLLALEEEIAREVTLSIAGRLLPAERARLAHRPTENSQAYEHFLRANYYLNRRTPRTVSRAIEEYQAALRLDPRYVRALARVAYSYGILLNRGWEYGGLRPESLAAHALAIADSALKLDAAAADAWLARANLLRVLQPREIDEMRNALERAIALEPGNAEAYFLYGIILRDFGDGAGAERALHQSLVLEPDRPHTLVVLGNGAFIDRRYEEAVRWLDSAVVIDSSFPDAYASRGLFRLYVGDTAGARRDAEFALRLASTDRLLGESVLALVDLRAGDTSAARTRGERLVAVTAHQDPLASLPGRWIAAVLVALGDHDRALDILERIPLGARLWRFLQSPEFDAIRLHPRMLRLVEESRPPGAPR
jgi:TolB-like protein/Flp pilus assembly protein TadD